MPLLHLLWCILERTQSHQQKVTCGFFVARTDMVKSCTDPQVVTYRAVNAVTARTCSKLAASLISDAPPLQLRHLCHSGACAVYVVHADIQNCLDIRGVRARVFSEAQHYQAYYTDTGRDAAIFYNSSCLRLRLGFETKERANDMQSWLENANYGLLLIASLKGRVKNISVEATAAVTLRERVLLADYDATASLSPAETAADMLRDAASRTSSSHSDAITTVFAQCQSIEAPQSLQLQGVDTAHVIPRGECAARGVADDDNNHLALTRFLHYCWDGPHHSVPTVGIRPAAEGEPFYSPVPQPGGRQRVGVVVLTRERGPAEFVGSLLKEGTMRKTEADGSIVFCTWVDVLDASAFRSNLQARYRMTCEQWLE
jgi:hypothetical protein